MKDAQHKKIWRHLFANEMGKLSQRLGKRVKGTDKIFFIDYDNIPSERCKDIIYGCTMVDYHPEKYETNRTQLKVQGNFIEYNRDVSTTTADTTAANIV